MLLYDSFFKDSGQPSVKTKGKTAMVHGLNHSPLPLNLGKEQDRSPATSESGSWLDFLEDDGNGFNSEVSIFVS